MQHVENVMQWEDIRMECKKDGGEDNQRRPHHIMHRLFKREAMWNGRSWQQFMEEEFMKKENLHHPSRDENPSGENKRKRKEQKE